VGEASSRSVFSESESSLVLESKLLQEFRNFVKFVRSGFCDCCLGTDCKLVTRRWENYIMYSLFCIFIIISSIISYFLCCLIKLSSSQPTSFTFCSFLPIPLGEKGRGERAAAQCLVAGCGVKSWQQGRKSSTESSNFSRQPPLISNPAWFHS